MRSSTMVWVVSLAVASALLCGQYDQGVHVERFAGKKSGHGGWRVMAPARSNASLHIQVALKQQNLDQLQQIFWDVSDPNHPKYGQHLSTKEINALVAPLVTSVSSVLQWLSCGGAEDVSVVGGGAYVQATIAVARAESMFNTTFTSFENAKGRVLIRSASGAYTVPASVAPHVSLVAGLARLPASPLATRTYGGRANTNTGNGNLGVDPPSLRKMYQVDGYAAQSSDTLQAVASFLDEHFEDADTKFFFEVFDPVGKFMPVAKIIGDNSGKATLEASLDVQYISAMGKSVPTWVWTDDSTHDQQEPFLAYLVSVAGTDHAPHVHSVSYADYEYSISPDYAAQVNVELMKAGVRGLSVLFASADDGVGCQEDKQRFAPEWPASSPYATGVGATQAGTSSTTNEDAWMYSGGGFSDDHAQPAYQAEAVEGYLASGTTMPPESYFNKSGRAIPDVSALGGFFSIIVGNSPQSVVGTSAATPVFAGLVSLLNDMRFVRGMPALGFLNPWLYANPQAFFDITKGNNGAPGCNEGDGFEAARGWDPLTGLGTPNFPLLIKAALNATFARNS